MVISGAMTIFFYVAFSFLIARLSDQMWVSQGAGGKGADHMWWVRTARSLRTAGLLSAGTCISVEVGGVAIVFQAEKRNLIPNYHLQ